MVCIFRNMPIIIRLSAVNTSCTKLEMHNVICTSQICLSIRFREQESPQNAALLTRSRFETDQCWNPSVEHYY
jgi:hypothetical protein